MTTHVEELSVEAKKSAKASTLLDYRLSLGLACLFLVLGVGNILFSNSKIERYQELVSSARAEASVEEQVVPQIPFFVGLNQDQQNRYLELIEARLEFYVLCRHGADLLLAMAAVLFSFSLVLKGLRASHDKTA